MRRSGHRAAVILLLVAVCLACECEAVWAAAGAGSAAGGRMEASVLLAFLIVLLVVLARLGWGLRGSGARGGEETFGGGEAWGRW